MTWFKVEDSFAFHRKAMEAGNAALGLWVRAGSYCAQQLTDGYVPRSAVHMLGTMAQARRLVNAGLWREVDGGFVFHQFTDDKRNPTADSIRTQRDRANQRQARQRNPSKIEESQVSESCHGVTHTHHPPCDSHETDPRDSHVTPRGRARRPDQTRPDHLSLRDREIPPSAGGEPPPSEDAPKIDAGMVVGRWCEIYEAEVGRKPSGGMRGQVGKEAKQWLSSHEPRIVLKAAEQAAQKGYPTLSREVSPLVAKENRAKAAERRNPVTGVSMMDLDR